MIKRNLITAVLVAVSLTTQAQASRGNELHKTCQTDLSNSEYAVFNSGFCLGYISGAHEALGGPPLTCEPDGVNRNQIVDIVKKYLVEHPEKRHEHSVKLIMEALENAFPCKESE